MPAYFKPAPPTTADSERARSVRETLAAAARWSPAKGTCVSYGEGMIGTSHAPLTRGAAKYTGGRWIGDGLKTLTHQESVEGHARSGDVRAHGFGRAESCWASA